MAQQHQSQNHSAKESVSSSQSARGMKEELTSSAKGLVKQAQEAAPEATEQVWSAISDIRSQLMSFMNTGRDSVKEYANQGSALVRKYPLYAVLGGVAVGMVVSRLLFSGSPSKQSK